MNTLTMPLLAAILILGAPMPPILAQTSTVAEWTTLLNTVRDLGIAMLALVVLGIGIIGFILDRRNQGRSASAENKVVSDMVSALSKVIEDYKGLVTIGEQARAHDREESTQGLMAIGDGLNRLADILDALKKQFAYSNDQDVKREVLLQKVATDVSAVRTEGSEPVRELIHMADSIQTIASVIKDSVTRIEGQNEAIMQAIDALTKARETCVKIAEDTGELPTISQLEDEPKGKTA